MHDPRAWPSLADQIDVAAQLYDDLGHQMLADWLAVQIARVDDSGFAREFSDHITLPGIGSLDYAHRQVHTARGDLVGGIRFYSRDITRPFVEVIAHSFDDLGALCGCVASEWSAFAPRYLRLRARPGAITAPNVVLDVSIHAGRYRDMRPPDRRVQLDCFADVQDAIDLVARRYQQLAENDAQLAHNISPADPADLSHWHDTGRLRAIRVGATTVGAIAIAPGAIGWIAGDEINEEVIDTTHAGHGYAVSAQTAWAATITDNAAQMLIGTIDRHNPASRKTATRAGRPRVLDDVFVAVH